MMLDITHIIMVTTGSRSYRHSYPGREGVSSYKAVENMKLSCCCQEHTQTQKLKIYIEIRSLYCRICYSLIKNSGPFI